MTASNDPRIAPLEPPYAPSVDVELTKWMPPGGGVDPLALFRTLAANGPLAEAMRPLGAHLLSRRSGIDRLAREVVIARVCANNGCSYEWGVHAIAFAGAAGMSEEQIAATAAAGVDDALWGSREAGLLRFADALCADGSVGDAEWRAVAEHFDDQQLLTLLALAGWYHVICFVANGARVPHEPWAPELPSGAGTATAT